MIVTILPSSSNFHAVAYNENKVAKGDATLLEINNFGSIDDFGYDDPQELVDFLNDYSSKNTRITKPQFHVAFSCKGQEMTHQELLDFAHQYLKEMGYGEDGQPLLVYAHSDTDNNHIHIITSRVNPNGKKIKDSNERRRSQKVIEKLLGQSEMQKLKDTINDIRDYNFRSVTQYRAILEALGYKCNEKDNKLNVRKGGRLLASINIDSIKKNAEINVRNFVEPNYKKLYGIFSKYRDLNTDMDGLRKDLRDKFGLELVFFGRKDSPYGYVVVDFKNKCVYEGSKIMGIKNLNNFQTPEERLNKIDQFIKQTIAANPRITQKELNKKLKRLNTFIRNGEIIMGNNKQPLDDDIKDTLDTNNKLSWVDSFNPQSQDEYKILLKFVGLDEDKVTIPNTYSYNQYDPQLVQNIRTIISGDDINKIKDDLNNAGYRLITYNGKHYIFSSNDKAIIDLERINVKLPQTKSDKLSTPISKTNSKPNLNIKGGSTGANREWEVGTKKNWDEVDNGQQMKY